MLVGSLLSVQQGLRSLYCPLHYFMRFEVQVKRFTESTLIGENGYVLISAFGAGKCNLAQSPPFFLPPVYCKTEKYCGGENRGKALARFE